MPEQVLRNAAASPEQVCRDASDCLFTGRPELPLSQLSGSDLHWMHQEAQWRSTHWQQGVLVASTHARSARLLKVKPGKRQYLTWACHAAAADSQQQQSRQILVNKFFSNQLGASVLSTIDKCLLMSVSVYASVFHSTIRRNSCDTRTKRYFKLDVTY